MSNEAAYDEVMRLRAKLKDAAVWCEFYKSGERALRSSYYATCKERDALVTRNDTLCRALGDRVESGSLFLRPPCDKPHASRVDAFGTYAVAGLLLSSLVFWAVQVLGG